MDKLEMIYGKKDSNIWCRLDNFIVKISSIYRNKLIHREKEFDSVQSIESNSIHQVVVEQDNEETSIGELGKQSDIDLPEFSSFVQIHRYLADRKKDLKDLVDFIEKSKNLKSSYKNNLENLKAEYEDLIAEYSKWDDKDKEELCDSFLNKFVKVVKDGLLENLMDPVCRAYEEELDNIELKCFIDKIDEYMKKSGFCKHELSVGMKRNYEMHEVFFAEKTDNPKLHETIKKVVFHTYSFKYYSLNKGKEAEIRIKGRVICYSKKL